MFFKAKKQLRNVKSGDMIVVVTYKVSEWTCEFPYSAYNMTELDKIVEVNRFWKNYRVKIAMVVNTSENSVKFLLERNTHEIDWLSCSSEGGLVFLGDR